MNKIDVAIYPLTPENIHIYNYKDLLSDFNVMYIATDEYLDLETSNFILFDNCIQKEEVDALLILPVKKENTTKIIYCIERALESGKDVFSMVDFSNDIVEKFNVICSKLRTSFKILEKKNIIDIEIQNRALWEIDTPIVTIAGVSENCGLLDLQLNIRKYFQNSSYRISQIGNFEYCNLFGMHPFLSDMRENSTISVVDKTLLFNRYIKEIEMREKPDLIIVALPDALLPYNNIFHFGFGNLSFITCNAFVSDYTIISLLLNQYQVDFIDEMEKVLEYRYNLVPDNWVMSNIFADYSEADDEESIRYYSCEMSEVYKMLSISDKRIINGVDFSSIETICTNIIDVLSKNVIY